MLIRWADLAPRKRSAFGRYVEKYMTPAMQGVRVAGNVVMSLGAWYRRADVLLRGLVMILAGWLRGRLFPSAAEAADGQRATSLSVTARPGGAKRRRAPFPPWTKDTP